jgi:hypothetical protein
MPKVRRSRHQGLADRLASVSLLKAFRCKGCLVRFYGLRVLRNPPALYLTANRLHRS